MQDEYGDNLQPRGLKKYYLKSGESLRYSWDMPAVKDKQLILSVHGRERRINIQEIGDQIPFRHRVSNGHNSNYNIKIFFIHKYKMYSSRREMVVGISCLLISLHKARLKFFDFRPIISHRVFIDLSHRLRQLLWHHLHAKDLRRSMWSTL